MNILNNTTDSYGGIFINQLISSGTYYNVWSGDQQIYLGSSIGTRNFYMQGWSSTGADLQPFGLNQASVVFTSSNAVVQANFKGSLLSTDGNSYANNSQRKFVRDNYGYLYNVYTSQGRVWLETSSDNGTTWQLENNHQPLDNGEGKLPSIDFASKNSSTERIVIVYQEKYGSNSKIKMKYFIRGYNEVLVFTDEKEIATVTGDYYATNTTPVVGLHSNAAANSPNPVTVIWKNGNLYGWYSTVDATIGTGSPVSLTWTTSNSVNPTIYAKKPYSVPLTFKLAWEEVTGSYTSSIKYATLNGNLSLSGSVTTPSAGSGVSKNYHPSITILFSDSQELNQYLISEPFMLNNNSDFKFSVRYGVTDSSSASLLLQEGKQISFKLQLIDNSTGEILGEFDNVEYSSSNVNRHDNLSYQVNTAGIGNKEVVLMLITDNNFDPEYSLTTRYNDGEVLAKTSSQQITFNNNQLINSYDLAQNYPNPFNPATIIKYQIPKDGMVTLKIYDILGKEVKTLVNEQKLPEGMK